MIRPYLSSMLNNKNVHHVGVLLRLAHLLIHSGRAKLTVFLPRLLR